MPRLPPQLLACPCSVISGERGTHGPRVSAPDLAAEPLAVAVVVFFSCALAWHLRRDGVTWAGLWAGEAEVVRRGRGWGQRSAQRRIGEGFVKETQELMEDAMTRMNSTAAPRAARSRGDAQSGGVRSVAGDPGPASAPPSRGRRQATIRPASAVAAHVVPPPRAISLNFLPALLDDFQLPCPPSSILPAYFTPTLLLSAHLSLLTPPLHSGHNPRTPPPPTPPQLTHPTLLPQRHYSPPQSSPARQCTS